MGERVALIAGMLPGFLTGASLTLAWWLAAWVATRSADGKKGVPTRVRWKGIRRGPRFVAPLAFSASLLIATTAFFSWPDQFWFSTNTHRIVHIGAAAGLAGIVLSFLPVALWTRLLGAVLFGGVGAFGAWAMFGAIHPDYQAEFVGPGGAALWIPLTGVLVAVSAFAAETVAARGERGWRSVLPFAPVMAALTPLMFYGGFAGGSIEMTGLIATTTAAFAASLLAPGLRIAGGGAGALATLASAVVISARVGGEHFDPASFVVLLLVPVGGLAALLFRRASRTGAIAATVGMLTCAGIGGGLVYAAVERAAAEETAEEDEYDASAYENFGQ
ncbi:MAG: hypothetical protein AAFR38_02805 [Planctomycetota bacterium]